MELYHIQNAIITDSEIGRIILYDTDHVTISHTSLTRWNQGLWAGESCTYTYLYYVKSSEIYMYDATDQGIFHTSISGTGIGIYNSVRTTISNTTVSNSHTDGVAIFNCIRTTISNVTVNNTKDPGIHIVQSGYTTVLNTSVSNTRQVGVRLEMTQRTTLSDSYHC